jgi:hypothetical protein
MPRVKLRDIAHSRAGDKGNVVNISVFPYSTSDYELLLRELTAQRVAEWMRWLVGGQVKRYEMPNVAGLNFVLERRPGDEVTRSLALDAHGKSLSSLLLDMEIEVPFNRSSGGN